MRSRYRNKICILLVVSLFILQNAASVYAAIDPDTFNPRNGNYVYVIKNDNARFQNEHNGFLTESVGTGAASALITGSKEYRYMIRNEYEGSYEKAKKYTSRLSGIQADDKYIDKLSGYGAATEPETAQYPINRSHFWWFKMSTESGNPLSEFSTPKVRWAGLYIYDMEKGGYQSIDLEMEVVCHSMAGDFSNKIPALFSVSKGVNGLPPIRIYHIRAIQLKFKAYKAGSREYYPLKTCITFGDVDGRQSVSMPADCVNGVVAKDTANILFGPYGTGQGWWTATGNTDDNISEEGSDADNYKIAFNIDTEKSGTEGFDLAFTSSQKDKGKPTGNWAKFSASTYDDPEKAPDTPVIGTPLKFVSDTDSTNDVDQGAKNVNGIDSPTMSHNMIAEAGEEITYTIVQRMPPHLYSNISSADMSKLEFSDEVDECMEYVKGSFRVYAVKDSADVYEDLLRAPTSLEKYEGNDVTSEFSVSDADNMLTASWKSTNQDTERDRILYGDGDGAVIKFVFKAKIRQDKSIEEIRSHVGADGKPHYDSSSDTFDIPNRAFIGYTLGNKTDSCGTVNAKYDENGSEGDSEKNSYVYTRLVFPDSEEGIPRSDITVTKNVTGSLGDTIKEFRFTIAIEGAERGETYTIKKNGKDLTMEADDSGTISYDFKLKDDEKIVFTGLPVRNGNGDVKYRVSEDKSNHVAEFRTDTGIVGNNSASGKAIRTPELTVGTDHLVAFTNNRDLTIPTGIDDTGAELVPVLILLLEAGALIIIKVLISR